MSDIALDTELPAPVVRRRRTEFVGATFATAGAAMYFAGLFAIYLAERASFLAASPDASWIPDSANMQLTQPTVIAWTLIMSVATMQWAVYATARNDRGHSLIALAVTFLFGVAVINQVVFQFLQMGLVIDDGSAATVLIYTICGSHVALVAIALVYMAIWAFRNLASSNTSINSQGIASLAVFWYGLVVAYQIIWIAIFVAK
jgi:heme/copper-type cytochrome/quinol oxidase subunit 3